MSLLRLIARSLVYHRRMHAGLVLGTVIACAVLTGALLVGDSVDYSLRAIATARLGSIKYAMDWTNRSFNTGLAESLQVQDKRIRATAVLKLHGMLSLPPDRGVARNQVNRALVLGVESDFWQFAEDKSQTLTLGSQEVAINERIADTLDIKAGDDVLLRVVKQSLMPLDAPLSSRKEEQTIACLVTVKAVLSDAQLGRFNLAANQSMPCNVFVDRKWLQEQTGNANLANMLLAGGDLSSEDAGAALDKAWEVKQVGLHFRTHSSGIVQLESDEIFLSDEVVRAALEIPGARPTLTYLVNSISKDGRMTPYSFVEAGPVPDDVHDGEACINQWLADQIGARHGDSLTVSYYRLLPDNTFAEEKRILTVKTVLPMESLAVDRELAPVFPGLSDVESCSDWSIGMPMDENLLKDSANEDYWKQYGQTPKLLVTLEAGQEMWANRFGSVTAIRFAEGSHDEPSLRKLLRSKVSGQKLGLTFIPVGEIATRAVSQAIDFGGLFMGMSFFLIAAALILLGLLYVFGLQHRASEIAVLASVGFSYAKIRTVFLLEACPSVIAGSVVGTLGGCFYASALLVGLSSLWPAAVAGTAIHFHATPESVIIGILSTLICALSVVLLSVWRATRQTPRELLTTDFSAVSGSSQGRHRVWSLVVPLLALLSAAGTAAYVLLSRPDSFVEPFFSVGFLFLIAELGLYRLFLLYLARRDSFDPPRLWKFALSSVGRRRGRSLSVAGLIACGCFLIFSVSAMQANVALNADRRTSGTGGFAVFAETTVPILGSPSEINGMMKTETVPLRVRDGDDAGCLNLNRAQMPRIFGVDSQRLADLGAFAPRGLWELLDHDLPEGSIPALVGDSDTAMWGLKKKTGPADGDVLEYRDGFGHEFKIKLVGQLPMRLSVFQGSLLISEKTFTRLFPAESGFRAFLLDANEASKTQEKVSELVGMLNREFERSGMEAVPAVQRLRDFYAVEATYLAMFLLLGGLGLILGAGGVAIVVLRNTFERRTEIAILGALGYEKQTLLRVFLVEHAFLLVAGIGMGTLAAALSIVPLVIYSQTTVSIPLQGFILAGIVLANITGIAASLFAAFPENPIADLRGE